jgi:hypothetical protein
VFASSSIAFSIRIDNTYKPTQLQTPNSNQSNNSFTMVIPHSTIPISTIRPTDILLLLALGTITEILKRILLRSTKSRTASEKELLEQLRVLRYQTKKKRAQGACAFVETSKLERIVLAKERELEKLVVVRSAKITKVEKLLKYVMLGLNIFVFLIYYGIPLIAIDGFKATELGLTGHIVQSDDHALHAAALWKGIMFPLSAVGVALKLSKIGMVNKASCVEALLVYWSAQAMAGQVYECVEALLFRY